MTTTERQRFFMSLVKAMRKSDLPARKRYRIVAAAYWVRRSGVSVN